MIAAEAPNPLVNELVILPDMEKRLEAFVRVAHAIVVFPGGVGTAEEILYLLGILLNTQNRALVVPVIFTGPSSSRAYFERLNSFVAATLGAEAERLYTVIVDDPEAVAREVVRGLAKVRESRSESADPSFFNWRLRIELDFQRPFLATHAAMSALELHREQPAASLAANLRRAFSGIVGGNVRAEGVRLVERHGPFELRGDPTIIGALDRLLRDFVAQARMRLSDPAHYVPCYRIVS
jgi:hypothetical protein